MDRFEFYNPVRVIFGPGEAARVGTEAAKLGKRALLVSYRDNTFFGDLLPRIKTLLAESGVAVSTHYAITANPMMSQVRGSSSARNIA